MSGAWRSSPSLFERFEARVHQPHGDAGAAVRKFEPDDPADGRELHSRFEQVHLEVDQPFDRVFALGHEEKAGGADVACDGGGTVSQLQRKCQALSGFNPLLFKHVKSLDAVLRRCMVGLARFSGCADATRPGKVPEECHGDVMSLTDEVQQGTLEQFRPELK